MSFVSGHSHEQTVPPTPKDLTNKKCEISGIEAFRVA